MGTEWYPFHTSNTVLVESGGTDRARVNGDFEACASRLQNLFKGERSTVLLGPPSFFRVMTILKHHLVGSPCGTLSSTSKATSRPKLLFHSVLPVQGDWGGLSQGYRFGSRIYVDMYGGPSIVDST